MPKFARPNSYTGKQATQNWTGDTRFANAVEAAAGESTQLAISPATLESAVTVLLPDATTTVKGKVELATNAEAVTGTDTVRAVTPAALTARLTSAAAVGPGASPQISNNRIGQVIFSGVSIAAGATQSFTVTNSLVVGVSTVVLAQIYGATDGAALNIKSVTSAAGSFAIVISNGTGATTNTANLTVTFEVLV